MPKTKKYTPLKIAIDFHDNDFSSTFLGVLEAINEAYIYTQGCEQLDYRNKTLLVDIINALSTPFYNMRQTCCPSGKYDSKDYLLIKEKNLYVYEEVDALLIKEKGIGNGEIYVLDTNLNHPNNSAVYSF